MPLQTGDIRFALPAVRNDTDNGGGPPTSQLAPDGASNAFFTDISEDDRVGGKVSVVHGHVVLRNTDTDPLLGANVIVAEPPNDDDVSITLVKSPGTFARRPDLVRLVEATSSPGSEFNGFLLENHLAGMRLIYIAQRPGLDPPAINSTLALVADEGLPTELVDYQRVRRVTVSTQTFTEMVGGQYVDFPMQVAACETFSPLKYDLPGSAANRYYGRQAGKTRTRRVNFTDAGTFYSASRLTAAVVPLDMELELGSIYSQIVPNTRTETPLLNQIPGGVRTVTLTDSLGTLEVTAAAHTERVLITDVNRGYSQVFKLSPPPAPNSVSVSAVALNNWTTISDDGAGALSGGPGSGSVLYSTGDLATTWEFQPDNNTFVIATWADTSSFVNLLPAGPVSLTTRAPEFELEIAAGSVVNGMTVSWLSGGVSKTATADVAGVLSGDGEGLAVGSAGRVYLRPADMPDPGTTFTVVHASRPTVIESFASVSVDAGGFATLPLADEPIPGTAKVRWVTARKVSKTSGANSSGTSTTKNTVAVDPASTPLASHFPTGAPLPVTSWRTTVNNSTYSQSTDSTTTDTEVVVHTISDDGAGGFGVPALGTANYAGKSLNLRLVSQGGTTQGYKSDQESADAFYASSLIISG